MFVWDDSIKTGVPAVDVQHKVIIDTFNELEEHLAQGIKAATVKKTLTFLKYYAEWHFEREEKCMDRYQCPVADINTTLSLSRIEQVYATFGD